MDSGNEFAMLLSRARTGDAKAMAELAGTYEPEVRIVAHVLLGPRLRPSLDSLDLVQSVHRSLFLGLRNNKFDISSPERLVGLAVTMVRRKAARHWRRLQRQQRLGTEVAEDGQTPSPVSAETDPALAVAVNDALQHVCRQLDETERRVVDLRMQGHSTAEIARQLGLEPDTLRVRLHRLRQRLRAAGVLTEWL
jgi:RNA polymerase sigma-70 factor (ECF subfamily)